MASARDLQSLYELQKIITEEHDVALSRATSVPEPIAMPALACIKAGASLTPSPTIATFRPSLMSALIRSSF